MAYSFDATVGGSTSTSYIEVSTAATFISFEQTEAAYAVDWSSLSSTAQQAYLMKATRAVDSLNVEGAKSNDDQRLKFPTDLQDDETIIPEKVQHAVCLEAFARAQGPSEFREDAMWNVKSSSRGNKSITYSGHRASGFASAEAFDLLKSYVNTSTISLSRW